jgi:4-hydroxybenzoate polyprenyltransferase
MLVVAVYPFMKRLPNWPQAVLGLAFGWGALMGWAVRNGALELPALLLYAGVICWIIGYDTIYAHQDREDDELVGMKSTALRFGRMTKKWLALFYGLAMALLVAASALVLPASAWRNGASMAMPALIVGLGMAAGRLAWQVGTLDIDDGGNCLTRFRDNHNFGAMIFTTLLLTWYFAA